MDNKNQLCVFSKYKQKSKLETTTDQIRGFMTESECFLSYLQISTIALKFLMVSLWKWKRTR